MFFDEMGKWALCDSLNKVIRGKREDLVSLKYRETKTKSHGRAPQMTKPPQHFHRYFVRAFATDKTHFWVINGLLEKSAKMESKQREETALTFENAYSAQRTHHLNHNVTPKPQISASATAPALPRDRLHKKSDGTERSLPQR